MAAIEVVKRNRDAFEAEVSTVCQTARDEIFHHFLLAIDGHRFAREFYKWNAMPHAIDAQLDPAVLKPFAVEAFAYARVPQHLHAGVFQHAGADSLLAVSAGPCFDNNRADSIEVQKVRKHQACRARAYNSNLCVKLAHRSPITLASRDRPGLPLPHERLRLRQEHRSRWRNA